MASKAETKITLQSKKRRKKKRRVLRFNPQSVRRFLISITILLFVLLMAEGVQIFLQFKSLREKTYDPRPVYIVDSRPIDIDAYLCEYFANKIPKKTMRVTVSAYSSTKSQTDGTPYITAYGTPVRDGIVAANFLPVGTAIRFPDKFDDKLFIVEDRMDERFGLQVDIWMQNQETAKEFGIQYLEMEIF